MRSSPPGKMIDVFSWHLDSFLAATCIAQAPVPQAKVDPTPLSQTLTIIFLLFIIWQKCTLVFSGNKLLFSNIGPSSLCDIKLRSSIKKN